MSDYKFKVGDRVMVNFTDPNRFQVGDMGTVLYTDSNPFFSVKLDKYSKNLHNCIRLCENGHGWHFKEHELQLIERPNKDNYFEEQSAIDYLKSLGYTITKTFFLFIFVGMAVSCLDKSVIPFDSLDNCADCFNTDYCTLVEQGDETELEFGLSPLNSVNLISNGDFASGSGWTVGAGWAITGGAAEYTGATIPATSISRDADTNLQEGYYLIKVAVSDVVSSLSMSVILGGETFSVIGGSISSGFINETFYLFKYITPSDNTLTISAASFAVTVDDVEVYRMSEVAFDIKDCTTSAVYYSESDGTSVTYLETGNISSAQNWGSGNSSFALLTLDWDTYSLTDACYCLCIKDSSEIGFNYVPNGVFANDDFWTFTNVGASGWNVATNALNKAKDATSGTDKAETTLITALDATECYVLSFDLNSDNGSEVEVRYDTATVTDQLLETVTIPIGASTTEIDITGLDITNLKLWAASDDEEFSIDNLVLAKGADCVDCSCLSSCISLSANHDNTIMQGCNLLLEGTCDNNAFGFNFTDLSFTHRLRVVGKIRNMTFETESDYYLKSNGEKVLIYADTQENLELQILDLPAYVHSAVNMMLLCDTFTIDGVEYVKVGEYAPNWRKSSAKAPVIVTIAKATQNRFNTYS